MNVLTSSSPQYGCCHCFQTLVTAINWSRGRSPGAGRDTVGAQQVLPEPESADAREHDAKIGADRCRRNPSPRVPYPGGKQRCRTDRQTRGRGRRRRAAGRELGASWPEAGADRQSQRRGHAHTAARQPHHCTGGAAF